MTQNIQKLETCNASIISKLKITVCFKAQKGWGGMEGLRARRLGSLRLEGWGAREFESLRFEVLFAKGSKILWIL